MSPSVYIGIGFIVLIFLSAMAISSVRSYKRKKEKKKQRQRFDDFVINNRLTIDNQQYFNEKIIGIDRLNSVIVFLNGKSKNFLLVRLKDLRDCRLIKERNQTSGHVNRIYLQCLFRQKGKADVILPFYNEVTDDVYLMMRLSKRAAYWAKRINIFREAALIKNQNLMSA